MKIKAFLKKWVFKNLGYKILALVFAFILWLVILNVTDPETTKTITGIPVTIENEDEVLDGTRIYEIISGDVTSITISGSRSIISGLTADDFTATVDFSELTTSATAIISVELTGDMAKYSSKVDITVKVSTMVISIDEITTRIIPVELVLTGEADENEIIDSTSITPDSVTVTAPESVLDEITEIVAYIDYDDIDGSSSVRTQIYILDSDGNEVDLGSYGSADCSSVLVEIGASYTKTVSIYMEDPDDTTADGYAFDSLSYSLETVTIKGSSELIESIDVIEIPSALLDLSEASSNVSATVYLSDYLPDGVSLYNTSSVVVITANIIEVETEETTTQEETEEEDTEEEGSSTSEEDTTQEEETSE